MEMSASIIVFLSFIMMYTLHTRWKKKHYVLIGGLFFLSGIAGLLSIQLQTVAPSLIVWQVLLFQAGVLLFYDEKKVKWLAVPLGVAAISSGLLVFNPIYTLIGYSLMLSYFILCYVGLKKKVPHMKTTFTFWTVSLALFSISGMALSFMSFNLLFSFYQISLVISMVVGFSFYFSRIVNLMLAITKSSVQDPLTKLYNRRYFDKQLDKLIEKESPTGLIFMDIDNFKHLNDTLGHEEGDRVLKQVAELTQEVIKGRGVAGRYGGEEIVAAVELDGETLLRLAENIRATIEAQTQVTVSVGVALSDKNKSARDYVIEADKNMYLAKNSGKNKVVSSLVDQRDFA